MAPSFNKAPVMSLQPQRRFSHAGLSVASQGGQSGPEQNNGARRKISLYHNMKFASIMEEQNKPQQQQQAGLNPNAPSFTMQRQQQQQVCQ